MAATSAVVRGVPAGAIGGPTPSPDSTVGDLLDHVDGLAHGLQYTARKAPVPDEASRPARAELLAPGWRGRIPRRLAELAECWRDSAAWEGQATAGTVTLPAAAALRAGGDGRARADRLPPCAAAQRGARRPHGAGPGLARMMPP